VAIPSGRVFAKALEEAGVVSDLDGIERIVIDVRPDDVIRVHVQRIGDWRVIDLAEMLAGAEVISGG
jgi:hypothetical protein